MLSEDLLVLHDVDLGGLQQGVSIVEGGETEHLHHVLHGEILDGHVLHLSFQWIQVVELRESQIAGEISAQNLL